VAEGIGAGIAVIGGIGSGSNSNGVQHDQKRSHIFTISAAGLCVKVSQNDAMPHGGFMKV
jgi:hypothetical protein